MTTEKAFVVLTPYLPKAHLIITMGYLSQFHIPTV